MTKKFLLLMLILLVSTLATLDAQNKIEVSSKQICDMLQEDTQLIVLDVRTTEEFKE